MRLRLTRILLAPRLTWTDCALLTGAGGLLLALNLRVTAFKFDGYAGFPQPWYFYGDVGPPFGRVQWTALSEDLALCVGCVALFLWILARRQHRVRSPGALSLLTVVTCGTMLPLLVLVNYWPRESEATVATGFPLIWEYERFLGIEPYVTSGRSPMLLVVDILASSVLLAAAVSFAQLWTRRSARQHGQSWPYGPPNPGLKLPARRISW